MNSLPRSKGLLVVATFVCATVNGAYAVDPAHLELGSVYITPTLDAETSYVDNVRRATLSELDYSSWLLETKPKVQAWLQNGTNTYSLSYELRDLRYSSSKDDNFTDQQANLDIHHQFNARNSINVFGEYFDGHEERGTGLAEGPLTTIDEPVELESLAFGGDYTYGGTDSRGRVVAAYDYYSPEYQNFRDITQFRDYARDTYKGTFYWRLAPRTDLLAEVRYMDTEYDRDRQLDDLGTLDNEEVNYYVGASWEATAKTSGSVRVGMYDRQYDSSLREGGDGFSWEADVDYKLRSYSVLNFSTRRYSQETNAAGDYIDTEEYGATWNHDWNSRSSTELSARYVEDTYESNIATLRREDEQWYAEARYTHNLRRFVDIGGGYRFEDRDSTDARFDYDRHVYFIDVKLSL